MAESQKAKSIKRNGKNSIALNSAEAYTLINFSGVDSVAKKFAEHISRHSDAITKILLEYESYEVAKDETDRTLDLLTHLVENKKYFKLKIGRVATFLPRNQPLYALSCFVVVPSLMASEVHFRIPRSMQKFFPKLLHLLEYKKFFPNIYPTDESHQQFLRKHSALMINNKTKATIPSTDVVIFTGTPVRAEQLRSIFDSRTLFISNGSGHNPVIVSQDANLEAASDAVLCLQLYNQGQDCAAPNAILVHKKIFEKFYKLILEKLPTYKIGHYQDRSCKIGPISEPADLVRIEDFLVKQRDFIEPKTPGIIRTIDAIVEPTIINKPLSAGGNFIETFAPIIFIQKYDSDKDLNLYFEDISYPRNAMYVTVYGTSKYVDSLLDKKINGKILHDKTTILRNTHLHAPGIERGTKPYGGFGYGASNLWVRGNGISKPTLPQRDIYEHVALPIIKKKSLSEFRSQISKYAVVEEKNIEKLLRMATQGASQDKEREYGSLYLDFKSLSPHQAEKRYLEVDPLKAYELLSQPNVHYIKDLSPVIIHKVRKLIGIMKHKPNSHEEFSTSLYAVASQAKSKETKLLEQKTFFGHLYMLLFNKQYGPKLTTFLWESDANKIFKLLDF